MTAASGLVRPFGLICLCHTFSPAATCISIIRTAELESQPLSVHSYTTLMKNLGGSQMRKRFRLLENAESEALDLETRFHLETL